MKTTGLLIAAAVLLALTGALYWSDHHKPSETTSASSSTSPAEAPAPKILTLKDSDVSAITIKKKGADEVDLSKDAAGKWQITAPKPLAADQDAVTSIVSSVSSLNSERLVDEKPSDVKQFGLTEPALEVDVKTKDKSQKLLFGDDTPTGSAVFAKLDGDPRVFTVASYTKTSLDKSSADLRDKRLLTADFDKLTQIELVAKKQDVTFARDKDTWQILKPKPLRADNSSVEDLSRKLKDAKDGHQRRRARRKKSRRRLRLRHSSRHRKNHRQLRHSGIASPQEQRRLLRQIQRGPWHLQSRLDLGTGLDKSLDDFRNKKLFDFGFTDITKLEVHDGAKSWYLSKGGQDWWLDGKKMDPIGVEALVDKVRELSATKFPDSGFTTPTIEISVTSQDGKRTEKLSIAKSGDTYIAKRENEPALYELPATTVTDLQKVSRRHQAAARTKASHSARKEVIANSAADPLRSVTIYCAALVYDNCPSCAIPTVREVTFLTFMQVQGYFRVFNFFDVGEAFDLEKIRAIVGLNTGTQPSANIQRAPEYAQTQNVFVQEAIAPVKLPTGESLAASIKYYWFGVASVELATPFRCEFDSFSCESSRWMNAPEVEAAAEELLRARLQQTRGQR